MRNHFLCWKKEVPSALSIFGGSNMDLPLKRALRKPKPFLAQLLLMGKVGCLFLGSEKTSRSPFQPKFFCDSTRAIWLLKLLQQRHFQVRPGCSGLCPVNFWLCEYSLHNPSVPVPVWPLSQCFTSPWDCPCCKMCLMTATRSPLDLAIFPLGKPSSLNGSGSLFFIKN